MLWKIWNNFNGSIWQALLVVSPVGIFMYLLSFFRLKGSHYFFDPKHNHDWRLGDAGDYEPHSKRYQDLAKLAITLSAAAIAFLINVLVGDKPAATVFAQRIQQVAPIVCGFFGCCIACLVLFMIVQSVWYEDYCHSPDHSTYKRWKYAASVSLASTGVFAFVLGFFWLARNLFRS